MNLCMVMTFLNKKLVTTAVCFNGYFRIFLRKIRCWMECFVIFVMAWCWFNATESKPQNVSGQLSGEKTLTTNSPLKIKSLTNYLTPSCAKKLKIEKLRIEKFYVEILSEFSSRFSKMFIFVFVNFWLKNET